MRSTGRESGDAMKPETVRDVPLDRWGQALLEELLFRAAEAVSTRREEQRSVEITLTFRLTPNVAEDYLEIRTDGAAEPPLITRLPRPFD